MTGPEAARSGGGATSLSQHLREFASEAEACSCCAPAMYLMAALILAEVLVPAMALLLTGFELWPERVLTATFGEASRLREYDPDQPSPRRRRRDAS